MIEVFGWRNAPEADVAVIGHPVRHSLSPIMHEAAYRATGIDARYVAVEVEPGQVKEALNHLALLGYRGVNATVPHKQEAKAACASVDPFASWVDSVNTIDLRSWHGINTDAPAFLMTLRSIGAIDGHIMVLGAGGTARALCMALYEGGYKLSIYNRTIARASDMIQDLGIRANLKEFPDVERADIILNTTSASLSGDEIPIEWCRAERWALAYDVMYAKELTPFLRGAKEEGLRIKDGLQLLVEQGALAFEFWFDQPAPREVMMEAARSAL